MVFVDYRKAFDSIKHGNIQEASRKQGVGGKVIRIVRELYRKAKAYVKLDKKEREFSVRNGARQGDPLSSSIFNSVLEEVFRKLSWENKGVNINC